MNYIEIATPSLVSIVGRYNNKIDWNAMGTSAELINLTRDKFVGRVDGIEGIYYILPVDNVENANNFIAKAYNDFGIIVNLLDESTAKIKIANVSV